MFELRIFSLLSLLPCLMTYDYNDHGLNWESLGDTCVTLGKVQSPVDLGSNFTEAGDDVYFFPNYNPAELQSLLSFDGNSLVIKQNSEDYGMFYSLSQWGEGAEFQTLDIRFRSEAEHTIKGFRHPLEMQINHKYLFRGGRDDLGKNKSAVSLHFSDKVGTGQANSFLAKIITAWQNKPENTTTADLSISLGQLITKLYSIEGFYYYQGSTNYPSCTERTEWFIFDKVIEASSDQIKFFYDLTHNNPNFKGIDGNWRATQSFQTTAREVVVQHKSAQKPIQL